MDVPDLLIRNPLSPTQVDHMIDRMTLSSSEEVLDVGCGRGEILARVLERWGCSGTGIDPDRRAIQRARRRLHGVAGEWQLIGTPYSDLAPSPDRYAAGLCIGATHAFALGSEAWPTALRRLGERVRPGGWLMLGEGYWRCTPHPDYLHETGMKEDEMRSHQENLAVAEALGLELVANEQTSIEDFDAYEQKFLDAAEAQLAERPTDPERQVQARYWRDWHAAHLRWGRETFGFALYLFRLPRSDRWSLGTE